MAFVEIYFTFFKWQLKQCEDSSPLWRDAASWSISRRFEGWHACTTSSQKLRQHDPSKRLEKFTQKDGVTSPKIWISSNAAERTWNLARKYLFFYYLRFVD